MLQVAVLSGALLIWLLWLPVNGRLCDFNSDDCQWKIQTNDPHHTGMTSRFKEFVISTRQEVGKFGVNRSILDINPLIPKGNEDVRLVGNKRRSQLEGSVEVNKNGLWGTVCDDYWGNTDAMVVCRMLGYSGGEAKYKAEFGPGSGKASLMEEVDCKGTESDIRDCKDRTSVSGCGHNEDAGVVCDGDTFALLTATDSLLNSSRNTDMTVEGGIRSVWYKPGTIQTFMVSFYTILYGHGDNCILTLSLCTQNSTRNMHTFHASITQGWTLQTVNFTLNTSGEFFIRLHGQILAAHTFIALDKINLEELSRNGDVQWEACDLSEFDCGAGVCIPAYKQCNLVVDCPDGAEHSDEDKDFCGSLPEELMCSFENTMCGWHNTKNRKCGRPNVGNSTRLAWIHHKGFVNTNLPGFKWLDCAVLESSIYIQPSAQVFDSSSPYLNMCKVRFFLRKSSTPLKLVMNTFCDEGSTVLAHFNDTINYWENIVVPLKDPKGSFNLQWIVTSTRYSPFHKLDIQITNISLSAECFSIQEKAVGGNITTDKGTCDTLPTTLPLSDTTQENQGVLTF